MNRWSLSVLLFATTALAEDGGGPPETPAPPPAPAEPEETIDIVERLPPPGSSHVVGKSELERFEHDDVHKVLATVPGVYIREEDGYGLRPNIGMRGAASERSAKIALLEDDVLIAPAPYSAPAAYYFPIMTRMVSMEVTKGPAAIAYGPNTVGGALNLTTKVVPMSREVSLDLAGGSDLYGKLHASYGESWRHFGVLVEGVKLRSSGFKELDGGGDTGFDKNDVMVKARGDFAVGETAHELSLKGAFGTEVSDETYTGLADRDFAAAPYRRYAATQLDRVDWWHSQVMLTHKLTIGAHGLTTTAYRHDFSRDWRKLNGFRGDTAIGEVLANPDAGNNAVYYAVLTGAADSSSESEALVVGTNERDFVSQGVQTTWRSGLRAFGAAHDLELGVRLHADEAQRFHHEESYAMSGGRLVRDAVPMNVTLDATGSALALAMYGKYNLRFGAFQVTGGLRGELVRTEWQDAADPTMDRSASYGVLIPGAGVTWQPIPELGLLAGVHRGFVPVAPGEEDGADPESSVNYEAGARLGAELVEAEVIGFFSDYANLKGTCSFSTGCDSAQVDREFNGGAVHILGVEARVGVRPQLVGLRFPVGVSYTYSHATFRTAFRSDNPEWGSVEVGDELPYLPAHQLNVTAGAQAERWEIAVSTRHASAMRDVAGQGEVPAGERTEAVHVVDLAASVSLGAWGKAYATVDNLFDDAAIVSRRPFGARPGVPRLFVLGWKKIWE